MESTIHAVKVRHAESSIQTTCGQTINGMRNLEVFTTDSGKPITCPRCLELRAKEGAPGPAMLGRRFSR